MVGPEQDAPLGVELHLARAAEELPDQPAFLGGRFGRAAVSLLERGPLVRRIQHQTALRADGHDTAGGQPAPELRRNRDSALAVDLMPKRADEHGSRIQVNAEALAGSGDVLLPHFSPLRSTKRGER